MTKSVTKRNKSKSSVKSWTNGVRPLSDLIPYKKNPRSHTEEDTAALADAIKRFGFTAPVLIDKKNRILAGHNRALAAAKLGLKTVPVRIIGDDWTAAEKSAYTIWDNQSTIRGTWDLDLLKAELIELKTSDVDLTILGFSLDDLALYTADEPTGADPEEVPEPPKNPVSRLGDLWIMGEHKLLCGDSTKPEDVANVLGKNKLDLVFTDPPYNVDYSGLGQNSLGKIKNDDMPIEKFKIFLNSVFKNYADNMRPLACIYVCHPDSQSAPKMAFEECFANFFKKSSTIIWSKQSAGMGWQDYRCQHEPILYGWLDGKGKHYFCSDRTKTTIWSFPRDGQITYIHPTQKPVGLVGEAIENSSKRGAAVGDFFAGSGSTLIACEQAGRRCFSIEVDPRFCDVIIARWEKFSGKRATLLDSLGRTFAQVSDERKHRRSGVGKGRRASGGRRPNTTRAPSVSDGSRPTL